MNEKSKLYKAGFIEQMDLNRNQIPVTNIQINLAIKWKENTVNPEFPILF